MGCMRAAVPLLLAALLVSGCGAEQAPTSAPTSPGSRQARPTATAAPKPLPSPSKYVDDGKDGALVPDNLDISAVPTPSVGAGGTLLGADVSWPQCPKGMGLPEKQGKGAPMPTAAARFVIIGLTNGPSFVRNPCLADQVAWVRKRKLLVSAYAVVSHPDARTLAELGGSGPFPKDTRQGRLGNVGYQAALFNVASLRAVGLRAPFVWIDVETVNGFDWTDDAAANAAVVLGTARGYRDAGIPYGVYSTPTIWKHIVGDLRLGVPEWRPAGTAGRAEAVRRCRDDWSIQGGPAYLGQWVEDDRDRNITCPGQGHRVAQLFSQS